MLTMFKLKSNSLTHTFFLKEIKKHSTEYFNYALFRLFFLCFSLKEKKPTLVLSYRHTQKMKIM